VDAVATDGQAGGGADSGGSGKGGQGGKGGGGASGGSGGAGAAADGGKDAPLDINFSYDAPVKDSALTQDSACATATAEAKPMPLDMYMMLDDSGSMGSDCNVGQSVSSKWCRMINAVAGFVNAGSSAGMGVALQFFPSPCSSCGGGGACSSPAVPLAQLPGNAAAIVAALNARSPGGNTPTEAALRGIAAYTPAHKTPGRVIIGILATDGDPTSCNTSISALSSIISQHVQATGIKIFVIGMSGATFSALEQMATAGGAAAHNNFCSGAGPCHYYNVGDGNPQAFIAALQAIQQSAVSCTYQMPTTDAGVIDPANVTIEYTPGGSGPPQKLTRVQDAAHCAAGAWYYDNNQSPKTIILCPQTCQTVQNDPKAKIQILLGCLGS
jgi:hypothetical protein